MLAKFLAFSAVVIVLGTAAYVFVSNNLVTRKGQVVITDKDIVTPGRAPMGDPVYATVEEAENFSIAVPGASSPGTSRTMGDLSTVTTTVDGYGNRTETRVFKGHPRLRMVMVMSGAGGVQKIIVYGKNGGVRSLTGVDGGVALNMTADQLANKAEMFETALDKERQKPKLARQGETNLQPLSSSDIEINSSKDPQGGEPSARLERTGIADDQGR